MGRERTSNEGYDDVVSICDKYGEWDRRGMEGMEIEGYGTGGLDDSLPYFAAYVDVSPPFLAPFVSERFC
jgi:hypothetical protein